LAGGFGSRISEESHLKPKPMIEIGERPILWHIMKGYSQQGYADFIICAGYKQHVIKEYFTDYYLSMSDVEFDFTSGKRTINYLGTEVEPWHVVVSDTGYDTMTGGRVDRIRNYVEGERFMLTYGDGVSDIDLNELLAFHEESGAVVTLTGVHAAQRFGVLGIDAEGKVNDFREKRGRDGYVNGGFMVCEPEVFDYIGITGDSSREDFSSVTLEAIAADGKLACYRHDGFWGCMDALRDKNWLEGLWSSGEAPWKTWE
jgi:glucose-1-phosphate cytidylyltransferase